MADGVTDGLDRSPGSLAQPMLELGEEFLNRVEVGGVFGQQEQPGAGRADGTAHGLALVRTEIVHDDDVTGLEGWDENLVDIELETLAVDRSVDQPWCIDTVVAQCRQEGHGLPMTVRHLGLDPLAARRPSSERRHIGLGPGVSRPEEFHLPASRRTGA